MSTAAPATDVQPTAHEALDRTLTGLVTALPAAALGIAVWQSWAGLLHWSDVGVFMIMYLLTVCGVTVGFHRLLTHRSFKTGPVVRGGLAILGSAAIEGPVISWVADHRKHHAFTDRPGDPHSPHVDHCVGLRGVLHGLLHAHVGWLFRHDQRGARDRYAPDLLRDPVIAFVHRWFFVWALGGLALAFGLGWLIGGSLYSALTALLWAGVARMALLHHVTWSVNSVCHMFGKQPATKRDHSTNFALLSIISFGESWHNFHHAHPMSARHGAMARQVDPSAALIRVFERLGCATNVCWPTPLQIAACQVG